MSSALTLAGLLRPLASASGAAANASPNAQADANRYFEAATTGRVMVISEAPGAPLEEVRAVKVPRL
jgi:hypothetical protein